MKCITHKIARPAIFGIALAAFSGAALSGCPSGGPGGGQLDYDAGFVAGFAEDAEYWQGYDDSWDTRDGGTIYYTGDEIPYYDDLTYDAGYWDGVWYAYHDGYFVAYDYAFTIGFSEGYDLAFAPDYLDFLAVDQHVEWVDGGFTDGYNDGFSEGRIFGAADYRDGLVYDWFDAMEWYRAGNDAYIAPLDLGSGELGPVYLYEYGTNPFELVKGNKAAATVRLPVGPERAIRHGLQPKAASKQTDPPAISYRALPDTERQELQVRPNVSPRGESRTITLESTWLERVQQYQNWVSTSSTVKAQRVAESPRTPVQR